MFKCQNTICYVSHNQIDLGIYHKYLNSDHIHNNKIDKKYDGSSIKSG